MVKHVVEKGAKIDTFTNGLLTDAIETNDVDMVKFLAEKGLTMNQNSFNVAIGTGNLEMMKYLFSLEPNRRVLFNDNSLGYAIQTGNMDVIKFVKEAGYTVVRPNHLDMAIKTGNLDIIKFVKDWGMGLDYDSYGLGVATENMEIIKFLESRGGVPKSGDLNVALKTGNMEIIKYLVDQDVNVNQNAMDYALISRDKEVIQYAIDLGAPIKSVTLTHAINHRNFEIVRMVAENGGIPNSASLQSAIKTKNPEMLAFVESMVIDEINKDVSKIYSLLSTFSTENVKNALLNSYQDLSKSDDVFLSRSICEELSEYSGEEHYYKGSFKELFFEELKKYKDDHQIKTELPANLFDRIMINQSNFMKDRDSFYRVLNTVVNTSQPLNEALRSKNRKEVQNWLMQMSTKAILVSDHENTFNLASHIPQLISEKKAKLEIEGMKEIDRTLPKGEDRSKNQVRFDAIKKLRNKINNQTRINFTKADLKEVDIRENNREYQKMQAMRDTLLEGNREAWDQTEVEAYEEMTTALINHSDGDFDDKSELVERIIHDENFGVAKIPAQKMDIEVEGKKYKFEVLDKKDPLGLVVGELAYSGCCFTMNGESRLSLRESFTNPDTGILTVRDDKGKFLAQSWIWLTKDGKSLVLDNVEFATWIKKLNSNSGQAKVFDVIFKGGKKNKAPNPRIAIQEAYREFAKQYKAQTGLNIVVGSGYDSLGISQMGLEQVDNWYVYPNYPDNSRIGERDLYTDAENVYKLANWYNNYIKTYGMKK
jgi:hypothetical protein